MNKAKCLSERFSSRTVGVLILPLALFIGAIGALIVPVLGLFFALPLLVLAGGFIAAPKSETCKLLLADR